MFDFGEIYRLDAKRVKKVPKNNKLFLSDEIITVYGMRGCIT